MYSDTAVLQKIKHDRTGRRPTGGSPFVLQSYFAVDPAFEVFGKFGEEEAGLFFETGDVGVFVIGLFESTKKTYS